METFTNSCTATFRRFLAREMPPGVVPRLRSCIRTTACLSAAWSFRRAFAPQALHNAGRLAWGSGPRGGKPDYTGLDVIIIRDDKIAALYGFLDPSPS